MRKILIVDDEALTREGIRASIAWEDFRIGTVLEAENGREGLRLARKHLPEIILTDVRMPQMSGVDMAEQVRRFLPNTSIIFMSGYSDKEYLKAAIRYKAVRYVEKPLNLLELEEALREAVAQYSEAQLSQESRTGAEAETGGSVASLLSRALPHEGEEGIRLLESECAKLGYLFPADTSFTVMILKFAEKHLSDLETPEARLAMQESQRECVSYFARFSLQEVHLHKYDRYLIYFLYGPRPSGETILRIARKIQTLYRTIGDLFLAVGRTCPGVGRAYDSYASAVILMRSSFFYERGSIITEEDSENAGRAVNLSGYAARFGELLRERDREAVDTFLEDVFAQCRGVHTLLPNQVKDEYYKLFIALENAAHASLIETVQEGGSVLDILDRAHTLTELHGALQRAVSEYFEVMEAYQPENATVFAIKEYIARQYADPALSVKTISDHVHRSASYVCTLFKGATDQTLNQFITEYRIERAKRLLEDPCFKIAEISSRVGYVDGNYFGKCFKKYVGLSPSEYRDKMLG